MPGFNPLGGPSLTQLGKLAGEQHDPQLSGERSIAMNLGHDGGAKLGSMGIKTAGVSMPSNTNTLPTNTNTTPAPALPGASPTPLVAIPSSSGAVPTIATPGASVGDVIKTASALATEDEWAQYTPKDPTTVEYIKGPDGVIRPTITISDPNIVGPAAAGGSGASGDHGGPPPPKSPTPPPLVSAGPVKKSSAWLWLALAAAAAAALFT